MHAHSPVVRSGERLVVALQAILCDGIFTHEYRSLVDSFGSVTYLLWQVLHPTAGLADSVDVFTR